MPWGPSANCITVVLVVYFSCFLKLSSTYLQCDIEVRLNGVEGLKNRENLLNGRVVVLAEVTLQNVYNSLRRIGKHIKKILFVLFSAFSDTIYSETFLNC